MAKQGWKGSALVEALEDADRQRPGVLLNGWRQRLREEANIRSQPWNLG
jgi:hypothetical protein